jgi:hypothetical protein
MLSVHILNKIREILSNSRYWYGDT